jgi:hypothetical protein
MKRTLIASIVGGIILFFWQFLSNAALDLHRPAQQYTPKQDSILRYLSHNLEPGRYFMPTFPAGSPDEARQKLSAEANGKPWALVELHAKWNGGSMTMQLLRSLLTNIVIVWLLCWIIGKMRYPSFSSIFLTTLTVGMIAFLAFPYPNFIWFETPGIWAHFNDAWIPYALTGLWLGWYLRRA